MARELKFDLSIETNALLCPNPNEFYSKAYITADVVDNYRTLPGVKSATKIANQTFTNILKASSCNFGTTTESLDAIDIDVCAVSALGEICQFDLETSFVSLQMAQGSNGNYVVADYMAHYWEAMASEIEEEVELIRWQGDTTLTATTYLNLCDGYEKTLLADSDVIDVTLSAITTANVIDAITAVVEALPTPLTSKRQDLRLYVAPNVAIAYELAAAQGNTMAFITETLGLKFISIKMVVAEGMSTNKMVLTRKQNMIYAFDGEGDGKALKAVDLSESVAEPKLRTRANMKIGFHIANPTEIVYFN